MTTTKKPRLCADCGTELSARTRTGYCKYHSGRRNAPRIRKRTYEQYLTSAYRCWKRRREARA